MHNIIVFGPPGSGKGTQSAKLVKRYGLNHLSTGAMLRDEVARGSELGNLVENIIRRGDFVPDEIVLRMALRFAVEHSTDNGVVFDGFPRNRHQAELLDRVLRKKGIPIDLVIYIDISEEEAVNRIVGRSENSHRDDDRVDVILHRINVFKEQTFPVIQYYHVQKKFACVSGMHPIGDVFENICRIINKRLPDLA